MLIKRCLFTTAALALIIALGACGGNAAGSSAARPSASVSTPAKVASPAGQPAGAAPSAAVIGQKAPGPYTPSGSVTVTNGQASIEATDTLRWQPNTIVAKAGEQVTLQIKNSGATAHTFIGPNINVAVGRAVPAGQMTTLSFAAPSQPGAYQFWCDVPGHAEAGMVGELIIQ